MTNSTKKPSETIREVGEHTARKTHEISEKLANMSDEALDKVDDAIKAIQDHSHEYTEMIEDYVQKKPLKALGIAVLAGACLATFLRVFQK